ncbi:MAG: AraC family transcriptional regulator, partial [Sphingobacteriales bacterium]
PGQVHSWNFSQEPDGFVINFSEQLFQKYLNGVQYLEQFTFFNGRAADCVINLESDTAKKILVLLSGIVKEVEQPGLLAGDLIIASLTQIFIVAQRAMGSAMPDAAPPQNQIIIHHFRKLVEQYFSEKRLPRDYASMLYVTPNHLNALSKDLLGKPAGEIIRDRILLEAKRLLTNADLQISEIASRLSFTDNSHFTRFFKKYTERTPEEFRKAPIDNG